jgi:hypothetical protein
MAPTLLVKRSPLPPSESWCDDGSTDGRPGEPASAAAMFRVQGKPAAFLPFTA